MKKELIEDQETVKKELTVREILSDIIHSSGTESVIDALERQYECYLELLDQDHVVIDAWYNYHISKLLKQLVRTAKKEYNFGI